MHTSLHEWSFHDELGRVEGEGESLCLEHRNDTQHRLGLRLCPLRRDLDDTAYAPVLGGATKQRQRELLIAEVERALCRSAVPPLS